MKFWLVLTNKPDSIIIDDVVLAVRIYGCGCCVTMATTHRKVLIAVDSSQQAENAFNCKHFSATCDIGMSRLCYEHAVRPSVCQSACNIGGL